MFSHWMTKYLSLRTLLIPTFLTISALLCLPLLRDLYSSCRGDWDYFFSLYEVASISVFEYHQFPLWNPYFGGGMSLIGNPQAGYLSPIFVLIALFGVVAGLKIAVWLHTLMGLWGMWLLSGHLGIKGPARCAPPVVFMFTSCWAFHLAEGHIVWLPAAFLPFLFLSFLKGLDSRKWLLVAAVVESIMFYEGGTYILAFSVLYILAYTVVLSCESRRLQPLAVFAGVNTIAALLSAPKLLPVLELLAQNRRTTDSGTGFSLSDYHMFFVDRSQSFSTTFQGHGWWEYGAYLGILGVTLYLFSLTLYSERKSLILASLFILLIAFGNFAPYAPWNILHSLPVFSFFKISARALLVFVFSAALLIGLILEKIQRTGEKYALVVVAALLMLITVDLFSVSYRIFAEAPEPSFKFYGKLEQKKTKEGIDTYRIPPSSVSSMWNSVASAHNPFSQISVPLPQRNTHGGWSDQYLHILQNRGVVDAYETIPFKRNALPVTDENYRGEYYFLGRGKATILKWSPNRFVFRVTAHESGRLVINQNFWDGWRTTSGTLVPYKGLLSLELGKGDHTVAVSYLPKSFLVGIGVLIATLSVMMFPSMRRRVGHC